MPETSEPDINELKTLLESIIFAAGATPISMHELKRVCSRLWKDMDEEELAIHSDRISDAVEALVQDWGSDAQRGFALMNVANGYCFRTNPDHKAVVLAMREERPVRLSKAALETLSILAYRQPATKPEVDDVRGVDSGGSIKLLLERNLIRMVGKKEEPGRPILYGTTKEFLSFFNLKSLRDLPSLREFQELNEESQAELEAFETENPSLIDLSQQKALGSTEEAENLERLDDALKELAVTEATTEDALETVRGAEAN